MEKEKRLGVKEEVEVGVVVWGQGWGWGWEGGGVWRLGRGRRSRLDVETLKGDGLEVKFEGREGRRVEIGGREGIGRGWDQSW